jgi:hypothetical protein
MVQNDYGQRPCATIAPGLPPAQAHGKGSRNDRHQPGVRRQRAGDRRRRLAHQYAPARIGCQPVELKLAGPALWTPEVRKRMRTRDGFRLRGDGITRLESLTEGAFALALTYLVAAG